MLRILVFLVVIVLIVWALTWVAGIEGVAVFQTGDEINGGQEMSLPAATFLLYIGLAALLLIGGTVILSGLVRLPAVLQRQQTERRREKGMVALTRGLEAVVAGDAADAQRHARLASKNLDEEGVTRLLTAQAAQLAGDRDTAQDAFSAMLEAPETEFLGLRGLYMEAMASGDKREAQGYAERAFGLRPGAEWAYRSVYSLNLEQGAWGDAREALRLGLQHNLEDTEPAKRKEAALLTASAYAANAAEDTETALKDADAALKRAPGFAPAAVLAAQLEAAAGRRSKGARLLDEAWAIAPHPALAKTMEDLFAGDPADRRATRLKRLADKAPDKDESVLLRAEQDIALGQFEAAKDALEPLLVRQPLARTFTAMAKAMDGLYGAEKAQPWFDRAAAAPLDPVPGADGVFHFTGDGWQRLIAEFGEHARLAPPPLEEIQTAMSTDEIMLLTAPPEPLPEEDIEVDLLDEDVLGAEGATVELDEPIQDETPVASETSATDLITEQSSQTDQADAFGIDEDVSQGDAADTDQLKDGDTSLVEMGAPDEPVVSDDVANDQNDGIAEDEADPKRAERA